MQNDSENRKPDASMTEPEKDEFWSFDNLLPEKRVISRAGDTDTDSVDVVFGDDAPRESTDSAIPPSLFERARPLAKPRGMAQSDSPLPEASQEEQKKIRTPGDVKPPMQQPVCTYQPQDSLLKQVAVYRWPARYQFYERFRADAARFFDKTGDEDAPFVPFYAYMPQYYQMTQAQLAYYFRWRAAFRDGVCIKAEYSYLFLFLYEIINLPERVSPADGLSLMVRMWISYRSAFPRLDRYLGEWVCDWCLIYTLPAPLDALSPFLDELPDKVSFKEFYIRYRENGGCPLDRTLLDMTSGYHWRASKYATPETSDLFETHLYGAVLPIIRDLWDSGDAVETLGLREVTQTRDAFGGALCSYQSKRRIDVSYISFSRSYGLHYLLTALYKFAENGIRAHLGIKARLTVNDLDEQYKKRLRAYFEENLPPKAKRDREQAAAQRLAEKKRLERGESLPPEYAHFYEPRETALDPKAALAIEEASWKTTAILTETDGMAIPEEAPEKPVPDEAPVPEAPAEAPALPAPRDDYERLVFGLSDMQFTALSHIIGGERMELENLCRAAFLTADGMVAAINECAVNETGDVIVDTADETYVLTPDYATEVTGAVVTRMEAMPPETPAQSSDR